MFEERTFSVYIHRFPNGKQYVGITKNTPKTRWANGNGYIKNTEMFDNIKHYGWDNIEHIIFNDKGILYTEEEACYIEKCLVYDWNLINPEFGYNLRSGGKGSYNFFPSKILEHRKNSVSNKPVIQYDLDGNKLREYFSIKEASRKNDISTSRISLCCHNKSFTAGGYMWEFLTGDIDNVKPFINPSEKPVIQYDLDRNKLREYGSITEASKDNNIDSSGISKCCYKKLNHMGKYQWRFKKDNIDKVKSIYEVQSKSINIGKPVIQYDLDGNKLREYKSAAEASRDTKILLTNISKCYRGLRKSAGGYKWKLKETIPERSQG